MWRAVLLTIVLLSPVAILLPRSRGVQSEAKLVHRCEEGCSGYDSIMERTLDLTQEGAVRAGTVAVRVCSKEPMPLALSIAAMNPFKVAKWMNDVYNYPSDRVVFLRSEDCLGSKSRVAATELWAVPKGAALPAFIESIRSSQAHLETVGTKTLSADGTRNYRLAVKALTKKVRAAPETIGVVVGYYFKRPSPQLKRRVSAARRILEQSGLPRDRYSVRLMPWPGERSIDPPEPEPEYPSIFIVEVASGNPDAEIPSGPSRPKPLEGDSEIYTLQP